MSNPSKAKRIKNPHNLIRVCGYCGGPASGSQGDLYVICKSCAAKKMKKKYSNKEKFTY